MCFDFPNLQLVLVQDFWAPRYVLGGYECIVVVSGTNFYDKVVVLLVSIFSIFPQKNILAHHYNWTLKSDIFRKRLKTCRFPTVNRCLDVSLHPTTSQEGQQMLPGSMELERRWWRRHWAIGWFVLAFPRCFKKKTLEVTRRLLYIFFSEHEKHVRKCWSKTFWITFLAENGPFKDDHWKVSTWSMLMLYENLPARYWSRNLIFWKEESNQTWRNNHSFRLVIFEDGFKSLVWKNYPSENYILGCYPFPGFQSPPWDDIFRVDAVCGTRFNPSWNLWRWRCCAKRHTLR